jgi:hypothetical protein
MMIAAALTVVALRSARRSKRSDEKHDQNRDECST